MRQNTRLSGSCPSPQRLRQNRLELVAQALRLGLLARMVGQQQVGVVADLFAPCGFFWSRL